MGLYEEVLSKPLQRL